MYKKEKKRFYKNLDIRNILDNKTFWKYTKPLFSDKTECKPKITLVNGSDIISEDQELVETFNLFFEEAVSKLDIQENSYLTKTVDQVYCEDPVDIVIETYKNHPSILKIRKMVTLDKSLIFQW